MLKKKNLWRGLTMVFALLLAVSMMAGNILELYRTSVDAFLGTRSTQTVTEQSDDESDAWTYKSEFTTAKEAYEGFKDFAIETSQETFALLKNENGALPLAKDAKITMLGVRSYAPVYGNSGGSVPDGKSTVQIFDAFTERGFQLNPETLAAYEAFFADKEWTKPQFGGGILPAYAEITAYDDPHELTLDELKQLNPDFESKYTEYGDAAIVVVGRVGGEGGAYYPGEEGLAEGVHTVNGNILSLSDEEMAMIEEAKANFDKVIVLVNAANPMEISNLEEDPDIDAILWVGPEAHLLLDGLRVRTVSIDPPEVEVTAAASAPGTVQLQVLDGTTVLASASAEAGKPVRLKLPEAALWSPEHPQLYTLQAAYGTDTAAARFGIRSLAWGREGLLLNGSRIILQGACIHHDNGLLGAVCHPDAVRRKVRILHENGYNAIRSAHNPCSKALLDACDEQGMLVMDEYIDHWYIHKTEHDYVDYFNDWWRSDLESMVKKDYNHPCVILYSTGNEVSETAQKKGIALTKQLTRYLHRLDDTRPVTCGVNIFFNFLSSIGFGVYSDKKAKKQAEDATKKKKAVGSQFFNNLAGLLGSEFMKHGATLHGCDVKTRDAFANMDIAGYNYGIYRYEHDLKKYPDRLILGSETFCSDAYRFRELAKKEPRLIGDFVWAGMDYLGEVMVGSWEYADNAPRFDGGLGWVSAGSGRIDLTGKPLGEALYTRVALEQAEGPFLAVRPVNHTGDKHSPSAWKMTDAMTSWTWPGCEGKQAEVEVYARAASAALVLNGKEIARKNAKNDCLFRFRCAYQPGTLEAVAYNAAGQETGRCALTTAGPATELRAEPEEAVLRPGQLCYIRLRYTDQNGVLKPTVREPIRVQVTGGRLLALGNACPFNLQGYRTSQTDPYWGEAMAIVEAGTEGCVTLQADSTVGSAVAAVQVHKE